MTPVLGLDLSLRATGLAHPDGRVEVFRPPDRGMVRLARIRDVVLDAASEIPGTTVMIEGYSMGSFGNAFLSLAELGGVVRLALWTEGIASVDVAPSRLKRYATGKGNADKAAVLQAAWKRLGHEGTDHNGADALWLRALGLDLKGEPLVRMPEANKRALLGLV